MKTAILNTVACAAGLVVMVYFVFGPTVSGTVRAVNALLGG